MLAYDLFSAFLFFVPSTHKTSQSTLFIISITSYLVNQQQASHKQQTMSSYHTFSPCRSRYSSSRASAQLLASDLASLSIAEHEVSNFPHSPSGRGLCRGGSSGLSRQSIKTDLASLAGVNLVVVSTPPPCYQQEQREQQQHQQRTTRSVSESSLSSSSSEDGEWGFFD
jgi:hypothetical protein